MAVSFDALATTTLVRYTEKALVDNIFDSFALFYMLKEKAFKSLDGGEVIGYPLLTGVSGAVGSYSGFN